MHSIPRHVVSTLFLSAAIAGVMNTAWGKDYGPGVTDTEIKIGNTMPYSGPASAYGTIGKSLVAYFKMVNEKGGINGRKVNFVTLDDGYNPAKTVELARKLVEQDEVLLLFQSLGTATNSAIQKYMNAKKVPHLFLATGASKWNDAKNFPWTMGWNPNYVDEGRTYARHIIETNPNAKIAVLFQNDDYGKDYLDGFKQGLASRISMIVSQVSYEVTDPTIDSQMVTLKSSGADTFFDITTPKFAAQAIKKAAEIGWKPTHYLSNPASSVASVFRPAGIENSVGIYTASSVKDPNDPQWKDDKGFQEWTAFMDNYNKEADKTNPFNVYAYCTAQTLHKVLEAAGDDLTRDNIMKQAANMDFTLAMLLPGVRIKTSSTDFAPVQAFQLSQFNGKTWDRKGPIMGE